MTASQFQASTATDYLGGWLASPPKQQCVDICVNSKAAPTCPTSDPDCLTKKQRSYDYDYLLLEQLFVPQFCRDLLVGTDSTISHQNVNAYPNGLTCKPEVVKSEMTIHGLWPNYNAGFAGCCNVSDTIGNHPYDALDFSVNQPKLLAEMKTKWVDPSQSNEYDSLCEIYNHEFQKHGLCYGANGTDYESAAVTYFRAALNAADSVASATAQINTWAAEDNEAPSKEAIEA
ncbi:Ribonuclease, partial [Globisporangium polare]